MRKSVEFSPLEGRVLKNQNLGAFWVILTIPCFPGFPSPPASRPAPIERVRRERATKEEERGNEQNVSARASYEVLRAPSARNLRPAARPKWPTEGMALTMSVLVFFVTSPIPVS